jgi:hypothetical protein
MYDIVKKLKEALDSLERQGFECELPRKLLIAELKRATSVFNEKTLGNWLRSFVEMGYIRLKTPYIFERCISFDKPYIFMDGKDYNDMTENFTKEKEEKPKMTSSQSKSI